MSTRRITIVLSAAALFALASCGDDAVANSPGDGTQSVDEPSTGFDPHLARADAQYLLGLTESDIDELAQNGLAGDVRVGRRGDETLPLIENYVNGRKTVEFDARGGVFIVTSVTVELPDGPETFTR